MWRAVSLAEAAQRIGQWWNQSPRNPRSFLTPDSLVEHAQSAGCDIAVVEFADWEEGDDEGLCARMQELVGPLVGNILLITEASFAEAVGAFEFASADLNLVISAHQSQYEPVFNGDVIWALLDEGRIICIHHEGHLIEISRPHAPSWTPAKSIVV